ncbi:Replicative DNA helicase [Pleomorphomonas sp. T1.2MG-36]|uniref:replicative DNA helicase n=1 Tax=Pleomorphomonas sp. T1.2MG-36 TaxID=3041167 RepID=UPI002477513F|nr:replicative DNA helicase [Pleomorphomonas sp. T1.2MG-36]CAI9399629.1 Replicative DNA helicase [Pleomorphomonas sp. T1.2MG-36]
MSTVRRVEDQTTALTRSAPHNVEAERQLLGAMLMNNETFFRVSDFLEPPHFFIEQHKAIYEKIGQLIRGGKVASPITLKTFYPADYQIAEMPVTQYLLRLASEATTIINAEDYGRIIHDLAVRRDLIRIGEDMVNIAYDAPIDMPPRAQIEDAERRLFGIAESGRYEGGFHTFSDALREAIDMAAAAYQRDGHLSGIATGLADLDRTMGGLQRSDLIILAARPAMGKTSLVTNIAFNVANAYEAAEQPDGSLKTVNGGIVGFFSLEMSSEQLATRILAEQSEVSSSDIRRGNIDENQFAKLAAVAQRMQTLPLYIDHTGGISIAQLAARARRLKRQRGLDVVIVDYLQLLSGSSKSAQGGRVQEITEITTGLKALAKELAVPIIALSQLSRQVESRDDKRPQLSDLRESGSIEQDADVVMFIYRDEYYLQSRMPKEGTEDFFKWQTEMDRVTGKAEVIIGKQRHGPTGTVQLAFDASVTRFSDLAKDDYLPERFE